MTTRDPALMASVVTKYKLAVTPQTADGSLTPHARQQARALVAEGGGGGSWDSVGERERVVMGTHADVAGPIAREDTAKDAVATRIDGVNLDKYVATYCSEDDASFKVKRPHH